MPPFLGAQGGDQSPLLPAGVGSCVGTGPGASPHPVASPGELVHPSSDGIWGAAVGRVRTLVRKRPRIPSGGVPPRPSRGSFTPAWPSHQSGCSRGLRGWKLAGASRNVAETSPGETKHHSWRVGECGFITPAAPGELTRQALSPEQRDYRVFIDRL